MKILHYKPKDSHLGDTLPLYHNGIYHVYYMRLKNDNSFVWSHISSKDMINWEENPDIVLPEKNSPLDCSLLTGCVFYGEGKFHAYYAGCGNDGQYNILHAVSDDGYSFTKTRVRLFERNAFYSTEDTWRDPCVYRGDDGRYHMIFCAKIPFVPADFYPGALGHAVSDDLYHWTLEKPLWAGNVATTLECPDVTKVGDKYALIYYWHDTKIRLADKIGERWYKKGISSPCHFDFMAAKSLNDGKRAVLFGWIPRKDCDCGARIWGGNLAVPRELYLDENGCPACRFIPEIYRLFQNDSAKLALENLRSIRGTLTKEQDSFTINSPECGSSFYFPECDDNYYLGCDITPSENGVIVFFIRTNREENRREEASPTDLGYQIILDFAEKRVSVREHYKWDQRPELAGAPLQTQPDRPFRFEMIVNNDILELCLDHKQNLSFRLLKHTQSGALALSVQDCIARFENFTAKRIDE